MAEVSNPAYRARVRRDFDRLAELPDSRWNHNARYEAFLLKNLPGDCQNVLDVGCGKGDFCAKLARVAASVTGIDLAPNMVRVARQTHATLPNASFECADYLTRAVEPGRWDAIVSVATLHHLDLRAFLQKVTVELRPGGRLLLLDLYQQAGFFERSTNLLAVPLNLLGRLWVTGQLRPPVALRRAWDEHGASDEYLTTATLRRIFGEMLPGARFRRHLFWRYSLIWQKP